MFTLQKNLVQTSQTISGTLYGSGNFKKNCVSKLIGLAL